MTNPDYKIYEHFIVDEMKVEFGILKLNFANDYILVRTFDTLEEAKECVRMCRKYKNLIYHNVED
jgi:hypothetical protein